MTRHGWMAAGFGIGFALVLLAGCGSAEPFALVPCSGKVTYDDDTIIPADRINITFVSQAPAIDKATHPPLGHATVNVATGQFDSVMSHGPGIVAGKHKVGVKAMDKDEQALGNVIPLEFADPNKSGIVVDTANSPFHIKVPKPKK